jgi:hypothetical protein
VRVEDQLSARSTPSQSGRHSGSTIAEPASAASTWSQSPCALGDRRHRGERVDRRGAGRADRRDERARNAPVARSASIAASSASTRSACASSVSISRRWSLPNPASSAAFSIELCPWLEA